MRPPSWTGHPTARCLSTVRHIAVMRRTIQNRARRLLFTSLKVLSQKFPGSLVSGALPPLCDSSVKKRIAPSAGHAQAEQRWRFTADELKRVSDQLEGGSGAQQQQKLDVESRVIGFKRPQPAKPWK